MKTIRLLLVDDHEVVRTGLRTFLQSQEDFDVVGEACNGVEAIDKALTLRPDVTVMDITMPEMDGLEATRRLTKQCAECNVLALTIHEDKEYFFEMMASGATGYISKQAAAEELVSAIRTVNDGNVYLQPALASWLLEDYRRLTHSIPPSDTDVPPQSSHPALDVLSKRERQVLEMVADGLSTPKIAEKLDISPKTVSRHRERIMKKLNMHSAAELVKFAIRTGLISV
jgi:two-component system, NarL family, response regulator NreC